MTHSRFVLAAVLLASSSFVFAEEALLQFQETGFELEVDVPLAGREVRFRNEPDFGGRNVTRGALPIGRGKKDFVGFAWDIEARTLYFDANRNLDLSDDPKYSAAPGAAQVFDRIQLYLTRSGLGIPYVLRMTFSDGDHCTCTILSGWRGTVDVAGSRCGIGLVDNLDGAVSVEDGFFLRCGISFAISDRVLGPPRSTFLVEGKPYTLEYGALGGAPNNGTVARLKRLGGDMGILNLEGRRIETLRLSGPGSVHLKKPDPQVPLPAGHYSVQKAVLTGHVQMIPGRQHPRFTIKKGEVTRLNLGAPLQPTLEASQSLNRIRIAYHLDGAGGERYVPGLRKAPPSVTIFQNGRRLGSSQFEYG